MVDEDRPQAGRSGSRIVELRLVTGVQRGGGRNAGELERGFEDGRFGLLGANDRGDHETVDGAIEAEAVEELLQALAPVGQDSHEEPRTREIGQQFASIGIQAELAGVREAREELGLQLGKLGFSEPEASDEDELDEGSEPRLAEAESAVQLARELFAGIRHAARHEPFVDVEAAPASGIRVRCGATRALGDESPPRVEENSLERHRRATRIDSVKRSTKLGTLALWAVACCGSLVSCGSSRSAADEIPDHVTPEIARASEQARQYERSAELWARLLLDSGGQELEPYLGCGRSLLRLGDVRGACSIVEQGLVVFPREIRLYLLHGEILSAANFNRAAERCFETAVQLDRRSHAAQFGLGRVRVDLGLSHKALEPLEAAQSLQPDDLETLRLVALASEGAGYELQAFEARRRLLELEQRPTAYRYVSAARLAFHPDVRERYPDALLLARQWIERAIELDPQDSEAHYLLACDYELSGNHDAARAAFLRAVEVDPGNLEALTELAEHYHTFGDPEQADRFARMALALERDRRRRSTLETYLITSR